jgi:Tol biopolymer transport system component
MMKRLMPVTMLLSSTLVVGLASDVGAQVHVVTVETVPGVLGTYPSWSPDGQTLAFERDGDLFTVRVDGSPVTRSSLPQTARGSWMCIGWRRTGVGFDGSRITLPTMTIRMDLTNSATENLTNDPGFDGYPVWSPNEEWIAFASSRDSEGLDQLFLMRSDGSGR